MTAGGSLRSSSWLLLLLLFSIPSHPGALPVANEKQTAPAPNKPGKAEPRTLKFAGFRVVINGLGPFRGGSTVTEEQLAAAGMPSERMTQLVASGDLAEVWE